MDRNDKLRATRGQLISNSREAHLELLTNRIYGGSKSLGSRRLFTEQEAQKSSEVFLHTEYVEPLARTNHFWQNMAAFQSPRTFPKIIVAK